MPVQVGATFLPAVGAQDPLGDAVVDFLFVKNRETAELDFKWTIDLSQGSDFARFAKDIFAFANYGGGHVFFGIKEGKKGAPPEYGLPDGFHLDQADLQQKFNSYSSEPIVIHYREFTRPHDGTNRRFAIVYVPPSTSVLVPIQDGRYVNDKGKEKFAFHKGVVLYRRGTQSIIASTKEQAWIERRAKMTGYQLSLLTGQPDVVEETLLSDLFPFTKMPGRVYVAPLDRRPPREALDLTDYFYHSPNLYCFTDPRTSPLADFIRGKVQVTPTKDWVKDPTNARIMTWMLYDRLQLLAAVRGISWQRKPKKLYYRLAADAKDRVVPWRGLHRPGAKTVAHRSYLSQLSREVGIHDAAQPHFVELDGDYFLQLRSTKVLTNLSGEPAVGPEEGRVITSFGADNTNFNKAQLRAILFWAYQLEATPGVIRMGHGIEISTKPVETTVQVGIRQDLPVGLAELDEEDEGGESDAAIPSDES